MVVNVPWKSITIGYQSAYTDSNLCKPNAPKPGAQKKLERMFLQTDLDRFDEGDATDLPITPAKLELNDDWVALLLSIEINNALRNAGMAEDVEIREDKDFCRLSDPSPYGETIFAKGVDTRCVLRGAIWVNERTYRMSRLQGNSYGPWQPESPTDAPFLIATLSWECQQVTDAKTSAINAAAARSRGDGTPAGA